MADLQAPSAIAGLRPPRKSIELEDPGAHYLGMSLLNIIYLFFYYKALIFSSDTSETEEEVFSDAQEGHGSSSGANSPIPTTRVEKVMDITSLV